MDIRNFIGMPLRYAISALQKQNIPYRLERTVSRSRFFPCDEEELYVVRVRMQDGYVHLLTNANLKKSDSVMQALAHGDRQE